MQVSCEFLCFSFVRGEKTRLTDVRYLCPEADIVLRRHFSNILKKMHLFCFSLSVPKLVVEWTPLSQRFFLRHCEWSLPIWSLLQSQIWILLIENQQEKSQTPFDKELSANCGPFSVSMVMAAWVLWAIDDFFFFDFDLFVCEQPHDAAMIAAC